MGRFRFAGCLIAVVLAFGLAAQTAAAAKPHVLRAPSPSWLTSDLRDQIVAQASPSVRTIVPLDLDRPDNVMESSVSSGAQGGQRTPGIRRGATSAAHVAFPLFKELGARGVPRDVEADVDV